MVTLHSSVCISSVQFAQAFEVPVSLHDKSLEEMGGGHLKWFNEKRKAMCLVQREKDKEAKTMKHILADVCTFPFSMVVYTTGHALVMFSFHGLVDFAE